MARLPRSNRAQPVTKASKPTSVFAHSPLGVITDGSATTERQQTVIDRHLLAVAIQIQRLNLLNARLQEMLIRQHGPADKDADTLSEIVAAPRGVTEEINVGEARIDWLLDVADKAMAELEKFV